MFFYPQILSFYFSVAMLCSAKNTKFEKKITISRFNQKSINEFSIFAACLEEVNKENKFLKV